MSEGGALVALALASIGAAWACIYLVCFIYNLIWEKLHGHRRAAETLHRGAAAPAGDGARGAGGGTAPGQITISTGGAFAPPAGVTAVRVQVRGQTVNIPAGMTVGLTPYEIMKLAQGMAIGLGPPQLGQLAQAMAAGQPPIPHGGIKLGEIVAYRCWRIAPGGYLRSCSADVIWAPNESMVGDIGKDGHGLGVHAWRTKSLMLRYGLNNPGGPIVVGSVRLWGEIVEHERGYRAQFASIASLDDLIAPQGSIGPTAELLALIRAKYGLGGQP